MKIAVIGLGLIGGSIAKAIKLNTEHEVLGYDIEKSVVLKAKLIEAIDNELDLTRIDECDTVIIALYPEATVEFIKNNADKIKKNALVVDCCGIKRIVCDTAVPLSKEHGFTFIGGHPMAGIEKSGFEHSNPAMFSKASMILTPDADMDIVEIERAKKLFLSIGFGYITIRSPEEHDRVIAYTSQLAHVLSNAYIKSPTAPYHKGISAGSFKDMTRVATLNPEMWTELFFINKDYLITEVDALAKRLMEYSAALKADDKDEMSRLLRDGVIMKAMCNRQEEEK